MSKAVPRVERYMTASPYFIDRGQTLAQAHEMMLACGIRHLPVLQGGKLAGLISERDLDLVETLPFVDPEKVKVEEAMSLAVYAVSPDAPMNEVVGEMAAHKYGSAVVVRHGKVVGIFTAIDAMRALAEVLESR